MVDGAVCLVLGLESLASAVAPRSLSAFAASDNPTALPSTD
jgi:hypothetical protein